MYFCESGLKEFFKKILTAPVIFLSFFAVIFFLTEKSSLSGLPLFMCMAFASEPAGRLFHERSCLDSRGSERKISMKPYPEIPPSLKTPGASSRPCKLSAGCEALPERLPLSLGKSLLLRRSSRDFTDKEVSLETVETILLAACGINRYGEGYRTAPSGGATYPLYLYLYAHSVKGLEQGLYIYHPAENVLEPVKKGDLRRALGKACLGQRSMDRCSFAIIITSVFDRITPRYGERGYRYAYMEAGHISQNIYLACGALGLGTVAIGAFYDHELASVMGLDISEEAPLYVMPAGQMPR